MLESGTYRTFADAASVFLHDVATKPRRAAIAAATAIYGLITLTNGPQWPIARDAVRAELGLDEVWLVNDFVGLAVSAPSTPPEFAVELAPGDGGDGVIAVIGPDPGLGVALLAPRPGGGHTVLASEGGHAALAATNEREIAIVFRLMHRFGHVKAEYVLLGIGLADLQTHRRVDGVKVEGKPTAANIPPSGAPQGLRRIRRDRRDLHRMARRLHRRHCPHRGRFHCSSRGRRTAALGHAVRYRAVPPPLPGQGDAPAADGERFPSRSSPIPRRHSAAFWCCWETRHERSARTAEPYHRRPRPRRRQRRGRRRARRGHRRGAGPARRRSGEPARGAPGTRETDALAPENLVDAVDAVVLSGGSVYGLDAAGAVTADLVQPARLYAGKFVARGAGGAGGDPVRSDERPAPRPGREPPYRRLGAEALA